MKTLFLITSLVCLLLSSCSKPEDTLVKRMEKMEDIMKDNMDEPAEGVDELIEYFEKHGPDTVKLVMEAGIEISNIEGEGDKEKRLKEIDDKLGVAFKNFKGTVKKFGKAVEKDEKAKARAEEYGEKWEELFKAMNKISKG